MSKKFTMKDVVGSVFIPNSGNCSRGIVRMSGNLVGQTLKKKSSQLSLFDMLPEEITGEKPATVEAECKIEGIPLTSTEHELALILQTILRDSSKSMDPNSPDFYLPAETKLIEYGPGTAQAPILPVTIYQLLKMWKPDSKIGSKDYYNIIEALERWKEKTYKVSYSETNRHTGKKYTVEQDIHLINFVLENDMREANSKPKPIAIILSPIFVSQIGNFYVDVPEDINQRLKLANGGKKLAPQIHAIKDWLLRSKSMKNYFPKITVDNFIDTVASPSDLRQRKKNRIADFMKQGFVLMKEIGLLEEYPVEKINSNGEKQYEFKINKDFPNRSVEA